MKKFHIALGVSDIEQAVEDYSKRFGQAADVVVGGKYALWRTATLNVSIRKVPRHQAGTLRHLGWENPDAPQFVTEQDRQGIVWEEFSAEHQAQEIELTWPGTGYVVR